MRRDRFEERAKRMTPEGIERQLLDQIYRVSQIASSKMKLVRLAFILSIPAGVLWLGLFAYSSTLPSVPA